MAGRGGDSLILLLLRKRKKKDWLQYTLDLPILHEPGAVTHYCSMGTFLAAETINQVITTTCDDFTATAIFNAIDIAKTGLPTGTKNIEGWRLAEACARYCR